MFSSGFLKPAGDRSQGVQSKLVGVAASAAMPKRRAVSSPAWPRESGRLRTVATARGTSSAFAGFPSSTLARALDPAGWDLLFVQPRPGHRLQAAPRAARGRRPVTQPRGQEFLHGADRANRPSCRSSSVRSAAERSARTSRWPRTPASAPAHSGCRPVIHAAVSLTIGWLKPAVRRQTCGSSPPLSSGRERPSRRAIRSGVLAIQAGLSPRDRRSGSRRKSANVRARDPPAGRKRSRARARRSVADAPECLGRGTTIVH